METWARKLDRRPAWIFGFLTIVYLVRLQLPLRLIPWFDELHTYYIAQAPTLSRLAEEIRRLDLNPPMIYALARGSFAIFGVSPFAVRLPSIVAFFLASAGVFVFLKRRVGAIWAAAAIALFWYSPYFRYATEARPYGLLLGFFALTLISWDALDTRRGWGLLGIAAGNAGMMLSHVFAPLSIMPFCVAELWKTARQRRIDWGVWAALLLPLSLAAIYLPAMRQVGGSTQPPLFQASPRRIVTFYADSLLLVIPGLVLALVLAFGIAAWKRKTIAEPSWFSGRDFPLAIALLLPPVLVNVAMMRSHGPFWDRYCITTALLVYVAIILFAAHESRGNRLAGLGALLALAGTSMAIDAWQLVGISKPVPEAQAALDRLKPDLPMVANSALTFLAMDYHENPAFLQRVYYLVDRPSALRYAQTDIFEGMPVLTQYFPVRAHVDTYSDFAARHRHFLVLGTIDHAEDWLLRKLIAEGAHVAQAGQFTLPYQDSTVYEVTLAQ